MKLGDTIIFRYPSERAEVLRGLLSRRGITVSQFLRVLVDQYLMRCGLIDPVKKDNH